MSTFLWTFPAAIATYLLFAGAFTTVELVAAVICGAAAAVWAAAVCRVARHKMRIGAGGVLAAGRALAGLPKAVLQVTAVLLRAIIGGARGDLRTQGFEPGPRESAVDAGRRAVALLAASLSPQAYVVRSEEGRQWLLVHSLAASPENRRWGV